MSTPLCMPVATPIPYSTSSNPIIPVTITLSIYLAALLVSACILRYFHLCSNPPPYECHISQSLPLTNLPACPHLTLSPFRSVSSPRLIYTPFSSSSLPPPLSSSPSKDSHHTSRTSLANSWSNSSTTLPSPNSSISERAQMISLLHLACPFAPPYPCYQGQSLTSLSPTPSTTTWRNSPPTSSTQPLLKSSSPSPELSSAATGNKLDLSPPLSPYPWPFASHPHPPLLPLAH